MFYFEAVCFHLSSAFWQIHLGMHLKPSRVTKTSIQPENFQPQSGHFNPNLNFNPLQSIKLEQPNACAGNKPQKKKCQGDKIFRKWWKEKKKRELGGGNGAII